MKKFIWLSVLFSWNLSQAQELKFHREQEGDKIYIFGENPNECDYSVEFQYTANNLNSTLENKGIVVIPKKTSKFLVTQLNIIDTGKPTHFSYDAYFVKGNVQKKEPNLSYIYELPFENNKVYKIYQGYNGAFSHQNAYSLDFSLNGGDKVLAAREGVVVEAIDSNTNSCSQSPDCAKYNNTVIVQHNDGSFAEYVHLKQKGALVNVGDTVSPGQLIAYSGATGWTKGSHLHFSVFYNNIDGSRMYIKTKFKTAANPNPIYLAEGKSYKK